MKGFHLLKPSASYPLCGRPSDRQSAFALCRRSRTRLKGLPGLVIVGLRRKRLDRPIYRMDSSAAPLTSWSKRVHFPMITIPRLRLFNKEGWLGWGRNRSKNRFFQLAAGARTFVRPLPDERIELSRHRRGRQPLLRHDAAGDPACITWRLDHTLRIVASTSLSGTSKTSSS
jgi:hypothetical protein